MKSILTRLRGVLGIGALWGALGTLVGSAAGVIAGLVGVAPVGEAVLAGAVGMGFLGVLLGTAFASALTLGERGRSLADLTPKRAAAWGGLVAAAVPVGMLLLSFGSVVGQRLTLAEYALGMVMSATAYGVLGAGLAAGTVAAARKADLLDEPEGAALLSEDSSGQVDAIP